MISIQFWLLAGSWLNKCGFPIENPGKSEKILDLGFGGVWVAMFIVNFIESVAPELRRIVLLHFGLLTFRFHFRKTREPSIYMIFGFFDVSVNPKTNYCYFWIHQNIPINSRKYPHHSETYDLGRYHKIKNEKQAKMWGRKIPKLRLINFRNS